MLRRKIAGVFLYRNYLSGNAKSGTFVWDGTEKSVSGFKTLDFIVNGNEFTVSGLNAEGSGTDAGTYPVEITGTAVVSDAEGNDVSNQFDVTAVDGTLTITDGSEDSDSSSGSPTTGDSGNHTLWLVLCAVGLAGAAGSIVYRRRKNS